MKVDTAAALRSVLRQLEVLEHQWEIKVRTIEDGPMSYHQCAYALAPIIAEAKAALGEKS